MWSNIDCELIGIGGWQEDFDASLPTLGLVHNCILFVCSLDVGYIVDDQCRGPSIREKDHLGASLSTPGLTNCENHLWWRRLEALSFNYQASSAHVPGSIWWGNDALGKKRTIQLRSKWTLSVTGLSWHYIAYCILLLNSWTFNTWMEITVQ